MPHFFVLSSHLWLPSLILGLPPLELLKHVLAILLSYLESIAGSCSCQKVFYTLHFPNLHQDCCKAKYSCSRSHAMLLTPWSTKICKNCNNCFMGCIISHLHHLDVSARFRTCSILPALQYHCKVFNVC